MYSEVWNDTVGGGEGFFHGLDPRGPRVIRELLKCQRRYREPSDAKVRRQEQTAREAFDTIRVWASGEFEYQADGGVVRDRLTPLNAHILFLLVFYGLHVNSRHPIGEGPGDDNVVYKPRHVELVREACASCDIHGRSLFFNLIQGPGRVCDVKETVYPEEGGTKTVRCMTVGFARLEHEFYSVFDIYTTTVVREGKAELKVCHVYEAPPRGV